MKMSWLQILFLTAVSASLFYDAHGFHTFRHQQPQDLLYLNFFNDDILEQDEPIGYKVPVEEIEFISDNEEKTTKKPTEKQFLIENEVKFIKDKNDITEAELTTSMLKEVVVSNTKTWDTKTKSNDNFFFQSDLYDAGINIQSPPKLPTPEPCPNSISARFTRVYLKAITNLIQHILGALFATNVTDSPKPETKLNNIMDSNPFRQIKKRDISKREAENLINTEDQSTTYNTKEITQITEKGISNSKKEVTNIINEDSKTITDKVPENKFSKNEIMSASSLGPSKLIDSSEQMSTNKIDISASSSHSTMVSEHPTTVVGKEEAASNIHTKILSNDKKEHILLAPPKDVLSIDDLINDEGTILNSLKITSKELHDLNPDAEHNYPKLVQHPFAGNDNKPAESTSGVVIVVTGTILVVLILVAIGAAVAYAVQKRYISRLQTANQNSPNQRVAMA